MSLKRQVVKDTLQYTVANYVTMAIGIPLSIALKAILGPMGSGTWALLKVIGAYGEYSDLGTRNAMIREIPQAAGAGDDVRRLRIQNSAFSFTFLASFVSLTAILLFSFFGVDDPVLKNALYVLALLVAATQFYNFSLTLLRTSKKVGALSLLIVLNMIFVCLFSIAGALWHGVAGLAAGAFLATVLSVFVAVRLGAFELRFDWNGNEIRRLLGIGFPMVVVSYALVTFLSLDSIMIAKMIGKEALGFYSIGLMSVQQISALGRFSQIILIPHIQERYGQTGALGETVPFFVRTTRALSYFLPLLIGLVYFLMPVVVHYFLPSFDGGVVAMKILVLGYFFVAVNEMSSTVLFTANKQKSLIPILVALALVAAGLNYVFIRVGFGIEGVAVAASIAYFLFFCTVFFYAYRHLMGFTQVARMAGKIFILFLYLSVAAVTIDEIIHLDIFLAEALLKCAFFVVAMFPVLWRLEKSENLFALLRKLAGRKTT